MGRDEAGGLQESEWASGKKRLEAGTQERDWDDPKAGAGGVPGTLDHVMLAQIHLAPFITCGQVSFFGEL